MHLRVERNSIFPNIIASQDRCVVPTKSYGNIAGMGCFAYYPLFWFEDARLINPEFFLALEHLGISIYWTICEFQHSWVLQIFYVLDQSRIYTFLNIPAFFLDKLGIYTFRTIHEFYKLDPSRILMFWTYTKYVNSWPFYQFCLLDQSRIVVRCQMVSERCHIVSYMPLISLVRDINRNPPKRLPI